MTRENDFIRHLTSRFPVRYPVETGIGDDGAVLSHQGSDHFVVVTDMLLDGVHFDLKNCDVRLAGRKALAVNLSDLAAMACVPTAAFISLAIPKGSSSAFLEELYDGIEELTQRYHFCVAGGDTNTWNGPFAINVCLTGRPMRNQPVLRSTAQPGDALFVTGPLGGSLTHERHLTFQPRIDVAQWLIEHAAVNAMMDISDGLSMDLHRMMEASRTAAWLDAALIPIHADVSEQQTAAQRLAAALSDGEDFELLVSVPEPDATTLAARADQAGLTMIKIGCVLEGSQSLIRYSDGLTVPLKVTGWQHEI